MVREDTIICMDNSEWMRNGDYYKTRFEAQYQAIEHILRAKTASHPENTVGLVALAGGISTSAQVLCSPTKERFRVGKAAKNADLGGISDLVAGLKVCQLALKFRTERSIQARIVVFVGSPLDQKCIGSLKKIAKDLKKNNIAVDVIAVGELGQNVEPLKNFIKAVEKRDGATSTFVEVQPGEYIEDAINRSAMGTADAEEEMDPMLAMALAESRAMAQGQGQPVPNVAQRTMQKMDNTSTTATEGESVPATTTMEEDEDEDAILQQAKLLSLAQDTDSKKTNVGSALGSNFAKNLLESAGVDSTDKSVSKELEELQKAAKKNEKDDKNKDKDI